MTKIATGSYLQSLATNGGGGDLNLIDDKCYTYSQIKALSGFNISSTLDSNRLVKESLISYTKPDTKTIKVTVQASVSCGVSMNINYGGNLGSLSYQGSTQTYTFDIQNSSINSTNKFSVSGYIYSNSGNVSKVSCFNYNGTQIASTVPGSGGTFTLTIGTWDTVFTSSNLNMYISFT